MEKKYVLTNETKTIVVDGKEIVLHRIQLVKNLRQLDVDSNGKSLCYPPRWELPKGTVGGYIEKEENLSQKGNCWIYGPAACVYGDARVEENATITGSSRIGGDTVICGKSFVGDHSVLKTGTYKDVDVFRGHVTPKEREL